MNPDVTIIVPHRRSTLIGCDVLPVIHNDFGVKYEALINSECFLSFFFYPGGKEAGDRLFFVLV